MSDESLQRSPEEIALEHAKEWASLPAEHLRIAIKALDARSKRECERALKEMEYRHQLDIAGMAAAFVIALAAVGGAIFFGVRSDLWMAAVMLSPSCFVIMKLFITRTASKSDVLNSGAPINAVTQPGSPPPV
ncbi:hypothetical protein [Streptomyces massasporeus]|uniref:hypothetical protein n=1 Tax=Streptomyces massasporeus TaxID=67324 RepID=UPI0036FAC605